MLSDSLNLLFYLNGRENTVSPQDEHVGIGRIIKQFGVLIKNHWRGTWVAHLFNKSLNLASWFWLSS